MKTLNTVLFFILLSSFAFSKVSKDSNSTKANPNILNKDLPTNNIHKSSSFSNLTGNTGLIKNVFVEKQYLDNLEKENKTLKDENDLLKSKNSNLSSQIAPNPWPFNNWVYVPELGWLFLSSDVFPYAFLSSNDLSLGLNGWVYIDVYNSGFHIYDYVNSLWFKVDY